MPMVIANQHRYVLNFLVHLSLMYESNSKRSFFFFSFFFKCYSPHDLCVLLHKLKQALDSQTECQLHGRGRCEKPDKSFAKLTGSKTVLEISILTPEP